MSDLLRHPSIEANLLPWIHYVVVQDKTTSSSMPPPLKPLRVQIREMSQFDCSPANTWVTVADAHYWIKTKLSAECWLHLQQHRANAKDLIGTFCTLHKYEVRRVHLPPQQLQVPSLVLDCTQIEFLHTESTRQGTPQNFSKHPQVALLLQHCPPSEFVLNNPSGSLWTPASPFEQIVTLQLKQQQASPSSSLLGGSMPPATQMTPPQHSFVPEDDGLSEEEGEKQQPQSTLTPSRLVDKLSVLDTVSTEDEDDDDDDEDEEEEDKPQPITPKNGGDALHVHVFKTALPGVGINAQLKVTSLEHNSPAGHMGIKLGDHIESATATSTGGIKHVLFHQVRTVLEHGPLPVVLEVRHSLEGRTFKHWFGGVVYDAVVGRRVPSGTGGGYVIKYNDGHTETKTEADTRQLVAGMGSTPHEHEETASGSSSNRCVFAAASAPKPPPPPVVEEERPAAAAAAAVTPQKAPLPLPLKKSPVAVPVVVVVVEEEEAPAASTPQKQQQQPVTSPVSSFTFAPLLPRLKSPSASSSATKKMPKPSPSRAAACIIPETQFAPAVDSVGEEEEEEQAVVDDAFLHETTNSNNNNNLAVESSLPALSSLHEEEEEEEEEEEAAAAETTAAPPPPPKRARLQPIQSELDSMWTANFFAASQHLLKRPPTQ